MKTFNRNYKKLILRTFLILFFLNVYSFNASSSSSVEEVEFPSAKKRPKRSHQSSTLEEPFQKYRCVPANSTPSQEEGLQVRKPQPYDFKYAQNIEDFDEELLDEDQRNRLVRLSKMPESTFRNSVFYTFRVTYYLMIGKHHEEIQKLLNLKTSHNILNARIDAYHHALLTAEEVAKTGGCVATLRKKSEISLDVLYKIYSNEISDFDDKALDIDQKNRLQKLCELSSEDFKQSINLTFKVVYYVMLGKHHDEIKNILELKTIQLVSSLRMKAYKQGILTSEELRLSGGRLEVATSKEEISLSMYKNYADGIEGFDVAQLNSDQKERLISLCKDSSHKFKKGKRTTFKVVYYIMLGKNHHEIQNILELKNYFSISAARSEAFERGYLTAEEVVKSGGQSRTLKKNPNTLPVLYEKYSKSIPNFDETKLSSDQKERLQKVSLLPKEMFSRALGATFKVVYCIMIRIPYQNIPSYLGNDDLKLVTTAGRDAYKKGFLTRKELKNVGLELDNRIK